MCGINGIYQFSGRTIPGERLDWMNAALEKRGPDAEGKYTDDHIMLGHRRLSIIDPTSDSNQPFYSTNKRFVLVFNGEIYNFRDLRSKLTNYNFRTDGDTEVVMAAYLEWGENCLRAFNGMFAFAIWDTEKRELFVARDRMGIKPLYYVLSDDTFVFSSSIKAIISSKLIQPKLSQNSLVDYLRYQTVHAPYTILEGVHMLMPGQFLKLNEEDGPVYKTYWSPTKDFQKASLSISEVQNTIRQKLEESVSKRLVSDVPFGAFLSGGIDSSILVALMSQQHQSGIDTFSVTFKENEFNEGEYAKMIADRYKTHHHEIELSVEEFRDLIPEALETMDHPSGDGPNTYVVSKKTRQEGIKMALSGLGGDELFGGYSVFGQVPELQSKKWLSSFPYYARRPMAGLYHATKGTVESSKIKELLRLKKFDLEHIYQYYRQVLMDDQILKIVKSSAIPRSRVFQMTQDLVGYKTDGWDLPSLSKISIAEITTYMQNVLLRDSDQMSMANGLELRVPFLDHELVEYVLGVHDDIKRPFTPKKLLVESCSDLIPADIYDRPKMGFVLPYEHWMKSELRSFCEERLNTIKALSFFHENEIDKLWKKFLNGNKRVTWSRIWPLVVLGDWIKTNKVSE